MPRRNRSRQRSRAGRTRSTRSRTTTRHRRLEPMNDNDTSMGEYRSASERREVRNREGASASSVTGFILSIFSIIFFWIPIFDIALALLGIIFSSVGVRTQSRGLGIAGLVISIIAFIVGIVVTLGAFAVLSIPGVIRY